MQSSATYMINLQRNERARRVQWPVINAVLVTYIPNQKYTEARQVNAYRWIRYS